MRVKIFRVSCMLVCLTIAVVVGAAQNAMDPTGMWTGDWEPSAADRNAVTVELKWDGETLTGTVNPGPEAVELQKCTFDAETGAVHMEADATDRRGNAIHYMIDKGDFTISKE